MVDKNLKQGDDNRNNDLEENSDTNGCINCIVVKPIIKIDVDISELRAVPAG